MKTARFHSLRDHILAQVDQVFAEPVLFIARMGKGKAKDPDRFSGEIEAILRVGGGKETAVSGGRDRNWRSRIVAQKAELHIDRAKYPTLVADIGDEVQALARLGEPYFEVLAVDSRGMTRLVLQLGEAG